MSNQQSVSNHRTLNGIVTKLVGDGATYGFINDEIFFQQTSVAGGPASVGDQVFAECEYSEHLPIKWNATSVKILNKSTLAANNNPMQSRPIDPTNQPLLVNQRPPQPSVAPTYQEHRQQRQQQRQTLDQHKPQSDDIAKQQLGGAFLPNDQSNRMADGMPPQGNFYANQQFLQQQQQQPHSENMLQPFPGGTPMGPPNFAFTSQLGSAFVQNQFAGGPFPDQSPQQSQTQQNVHNQNNSRQGNNKNQGGRFGDKGGDRQNRRNARNDGNKFERQGSGDRDGSHGRSRRGNSRERQSNRPNNKRDEPSRASPPPNSSTRSTSSVDSDRGNRSTRRHYEVKNIPRGPLMTNMNVYNMKQRCSSNIHVPSDLKEILINRSFRLNLKSLPKPITFDIEPPKALESAKGEAGGSEKSSDGVAPEDQPAPAVTENAEKSKSTKSEVKLYHKYGVKVVLISLPELDSMYRSVFGKNLDSFDMEAKTSSKLDDCISLLCNRGTNSGFSLIGGKFDQNLDGFVEGETNEFEKSNLRPNLLSTCKRVVSEQTGLDLSQCRSWTHIATFVYNHRTDYFSPKASVEYSYIYMPDIWTLMDSEFSHSIAQPIEMKLEQGVTDELTSNVEPELGAVEDESEQQVDAPVDDMNLSEMKVSDLKAELERRNIKFKGSPKKAELIALLRANIDSDQTSKQVPEAEPVDQLEVGDLKSESDPVAEHESEEKPEAEESDVQALKRKEPESESLDSNNKKPRTDSDEDEKLQKVQLIRSSLKVRSRDEQQQLTLINLNEASMAAKYDQFELSVASSILKESLVQHFSEYILTSLVEDNRRRQSSLSSNSNSQETNSDTNNNSTKTAPPSKGSQELNNFNTKEQPTDRYINLAFTYFDSTHMGYVQSEDLSKLFNNAGITISKRAFMSLIGDDERFNYRTLPDLPQKHPSESMYSFPDQFKGSSSSSAVAAAAGSGSITYDGVVYDVQKLVTQVREAESLKVNLVSRFNYAIENSDKQAEEIHVLEVSQKSLSKAIKTQNEEICDLKKERDSLKKKLDSLKKNLKGTIANLNSYIDDDK